MGNFKKGDKIKPKKFENVAKFSLGNPLCPALHCETASFHTDTTLIVLAVLSHSDIEGLDLLFCYDPNIGKHEWFQVLQRHAALVGVNNE